MPRQESYTYEELVKMGAKPGGYTLEELQALGATTEAPPAALTPGFSDERTAGQVARDQLGNVIRGVPQAITGIPGSVAAIIGATGSPQKQWELLKAAGRPFEPLVRGVGALMRPDQVTAPSPEEFEEAAQGAGSFAGGVLTAKLAPVLGRKVADVLPNELRARGRFEQVMGKAQDVPIDITRANQALAEAQQLDATGSYLPPVMRKFARLQQPKVVGKMGGVKMQVAPEPMTYKTGRRFASKAGELSASERMKLDAPMKRQVGAFARAMKDANREAAAKVGMADIYDQAMKEFRQAKRLGEAKAVVKKYAVKGIVGTGVTAGLMYGVEREIEKYFGRR